MRTLTTHIQYFGSTISSIVYGGINYAFVVINLTFTLALFQIRNWPHQNNRLFISCRNHVFLFYLSVASFPSHCASRKSALGYIKIDKEGIAYLRSFLHTFQIFSDQIP